jgi:hypothetical protein
VTQPRHPLEPADDEFFTSTPHVVRYQKRFVARPEQVWASLTSDISIVAWGPAIKEVDWTSPRPFGVGTTGEVVAPRGSTMRERYFRWDDGLRQKYNSFRPVISPGRRAVGLLADWRYRDPLHRSNSHVSAGASRRVGRRRR